MRFFKEFALKLSPIAGLRIITLNSLSSSQQLTLRIENYGFTIMRHYVTNKNSKAYMMHSILCTILMGENVNRHSEYTIEPRLIWGLDLVHRPKNVNYYGLKMHGLCSGLYSTKECQ